MKEIFTILLLVCYGFGYSQLSPVINLDFDNCDAATNSDFPLPILEGNTSCECGISGQSLQFNDEDDGITFDSSYTSFFQSDFTLSFYFMLNSNLNGIVDIVSVSNSCGADSSFTIKYIAEESLIKVSMARDFSTVVELEGELNFDNCWHQVVFQRDNDNYNLFLDGRFINSAFPRADIQLNPSSILKISKSPCQNFGDVPFRGRIDEFQIYNGVVSVDQIFDSYLINDEILTSDTTIFSGTSVPIRQYPSCAENINWNPSLNVNGPADLEPMISPTESTNYFIRYDYGICRGIDSISISIVDEELVECENLLLANAFTPNNDGLNDRFGISNAFIIEEMKSFQIFDRWGEMVFNALNKDDSWDGTFQNQKVNPNVFLYKVNYSCKGEEFVKTGSFSILR